VLLSQITSDQCKLHSCIEASHHITVIGTIITYESNSFFLVLEIEPRSLCSTTEQHPASKKIFKDMEMLITATITHGICMSNCHSVLHKYV
jgi:hypothetical protein